MTTEQERLFPLADILSVTTRRVLSSKHMGAVYEVLNYMTRDNLHSHQLPRVYDECAPWLLRWYPKLAEVRLWFLDQLLGEVAKEDKSDACRAWVDMERQRLELDAELQVWHLRQEDHNRIGPYDELVIERRTDEGIAVVRTGDPREDGA